MLMLATRALTKWAYVNDRVSAIFSFMTLPLKPIRTVTFSFCSIKASGEWHFILAQDELLWKVPVFALGRVGSEFRQKLTTTRGIQQESFP